MTETNTPPTSQKMLMVGFMSLLLGWLFDFFFTERMPGISWFVFNSLVALSLAIIFQRWSRRWPVSAWWIVGPLLAISALAAIFNSPELMAFNILAGLVLWLLLVVHLTKKFVFDFSVADYFRTLLVPFAFVPSFFTGLMDVLVLRFHLKNKKAGPVIKGVLMALPALALFGALFASADLVFKKYVQSVLHISISPEIVVHTGITFVAAAIFLGAFTYILRYRPSSSTPIAPTVVRRIGSTEINVMLGLVSALFVFFMLIQVAYLFGGEQTIVSQGLTYADYARRGFFELIIVAVVSFILLWLAEQAMVRHNHATTHFRWLATILIVCVLGIIGSAFMRLALYEQAYGFTTARLYSHVFTIWLGLMFLFLLRKVWHRDGEALFLRWVYASVLVFLIGLNVSNPDSFVARQNIERFHQTGKIDADYLTSLSADATSHKIEILLSKDPAVRETLANHLDSQRRELADPPTQSWLSFQWSRQRAQQLLEQHASTIELYQTKEVVTQQSSGQ